MADEVRTLTVYIYNDERFLFHLHSSFQLAYQLAIFLYKTDQFTLRRIKTDNDHYSTSALCINLIVNQNTRYVSYEDTLSVDN